MSQVKVINPSGYSENVIQYQIECPFCHTNVVPNYLCIDKYNLFASCPNSMCGSHFIIGQNEKGEYVNILPNFEPASKIFSEIITSISPMFSAIYNQAYHAEQANLDQISHRYNLRQLTR